MSYSAAKAELDDAFVKVDWHDRNNLNESSPSGVKSEGKRGFYGDWVKQCASTIPMSTFGRSDRSFQHRDAIAHQSSLGVSLSVLTK